MATSTPVPLFYRILFTYIDPMFCLMGTGLHLLDPVNTLVGYSPKFRPPPTVADLHLLDTLAGFFAFLGILEAVLLRVRANDAAVWRTVQAAASFVDILMVYAAVRALNSESRLWDVAGWRGDDWRLVVGNVVAGVFRVACALGIGFAPQGKVKRR